MPARAVDIIISGGIGDGDLYTRWGTLPTLTAWDGRPFLDGNNEGARMLNFPPSDWYIGINGFQNYATQHLLETAHTAWRAARLEDTGRRSNRDIRRHAAGTSHSRDFL